MAIVVKVKLTPTQAGLLTLQSMRQEEEILRLRNVMEAVVEYLDDKRTSEIVVGDPLYRLMKETLEKKNEDD